MSRLKLEDNGMDVMVKMSDGNPGALTALMDIMKNAEEIDPQGAFGGMGAVMLLDGWEIYGTDIYILYSDKCNRDVRKMLMLMRATQMGMFSNEKLKEMASDQMRQVNLTEEEMTDLDNQVCERLEEFARP